MFVVSMQFMTSNEELAEKLTAALKATAEEVLREYGLPTEQPSAEGFGSFGMPAAGQEPGSDLDEWIRRYADGERAFHQRRVPFTDL